MLRGRKFEPFWRIFFYVVQEELFFRIKFKDFTTLVVSSSQIITHNASMTAQRTVSTTPDFLRRISLQRMTFLSSHGSFRNLKNV